MDESRVERIAGLMNPLRMRRDYGYEDLQERIDETLSQQERVARRLFAASGDCYEANGRKFMSEAIFPGSDKGMVLVHGEVTGQGPIEGIKYGHCWIEDGGTVIDVSNGRNIRMDKGTYYMLGQIGDNVIRYKPEKFRKMVLKYEHWGPWELKTESGM
jgi:hypothetical protein